MRYTFPKLILILALSTSMMAQGQSNWERYEPRTLSQIFRANQNTSLGKSWNFSGKEFASIVAVTHTGISREIPSRKRKLILALREARRLTDEYVNQYQQEFLFVANSVEYWIPVQSVLIPGLREDIAKGETIKLYVVWAGYVEDADGIEPVFLVDRFVTESDERQLLTAREIAAKAYSSSVLLVSFDRRGKPTSAGSAFFVAPSVVATSYHVVKGASNIFAKQERGGGHKAELLRFDPKSDLALLRITSLTGSPIELFQGKDLYIGDKVYAIGNPEGLEGTFSIGNISAFRESNGILYVQLTAPLSAGSSGGAILNEYGEVIGIVQSQLREGQNLNFAVAVPHLLNLISGVKGAKVITSSP